MRHQKRGAIIHLGQVLPLASRDQPEHQRGKTPYVSLLDLAPDGVYPARLIAQAAVRFYRTLPPLPPMTVAVCFLWHYP